MGYPGTPDGTPAETASEPGYDAKQAETRQSPGGTDADTNTSAGWTAEAAPQDAAAPQDTGGEHRNRIAPEAGLVYDAYVETALRREDAVRLDSMARLLGKRVEFVDSIREGTANAEIAGDTIRIERGNRNPILFLMGHEITHGVQALSPEAYREFRDAVAEEPGVREDAEKIRRRYREAGLDLTEDEAMNEAAANWAGQLMEDGGAADQFIDRHWEQKTLLQRVRDAIANLIRKLKTLTSPERRRAEQVLNKFNAALDAAAQSVRDATADTRTAAQNNTAATDAQSGAASDFTASANRAGAETTGPEADGAQTTDATGPEADGIQTTDATGPEAENRDIRDSIDREEFDRAFRDLKPEAAETEPDAAWEQFRREDAVIDFHGRDVTFAKFRDNSRQNGDPSDGAAAASFAKLLMDQEAADRTWYSLKTWNGRQVVWIEDSPLSNRQLKEGSSIEQFLSQHIGEVYTLIESGQSVYLGDDLPGEYAYSRYSQTLRRKDQPLSMAKGRAAGELGALVETATNRKWEKTKHTHSKDAKYGMYRYDVLFAFPTKNNDGSIKGVHAFDAKLLIRNASDGKKYLYDIRPVRKP